MKPLTMPQDADALASGESLDRLMDDEPVRISHRPDGYHWIARDGHQEFGPYDTLEEAQAAMADADDNDLEEGESLDEAQRELGMAGWVDPDTGAPAEETTFRLEEH